MAPSSTARSVPAEGVNIVNYDEYITPGIEEVQLEKGWGPMGAFRWNWSSPIVMSLAYLGLGSNLDAEENLRLAFRELRNRFSVQKISRVYRSKALGFEGADFLNVVASIETVLVPHDLCTQLELIHGPGCPVCGFPG